MLILILHQCLFLSCFLSAIIILLYNCDSYKQYNIGVYLTQFIICDRFSSNFKSRIIITDKIKYFDDVVLTVVGKLMDNLTPKWSQYYSLRGRFEYYNIIIVNDILMSY